MSTASDEPAATKMDLAQTTKQIAILSIDGGGVRGLIPAASLEFLESELQRLHDEENNDGQVVRLADYFDLIAGTSTGGLVATMISAPDKNGRPLYSAKDITHFYLEHCPKIFTQNRFGILGKIYGFFHDLFMGPRYDGRYLKKLVRDILGGIKMSQTLTNLVITSFDVKMQQPVNFTTFQAEHNQSKNALLSDLCISTSAAPMMLPAHYFETADEDGSRVGYHMVDGGVVANNPLMVAMSMASNDVLFQNPTMFGRHHNKQARLEGSARSGRTNARSSDYSRYLVLSLGTGVSKQAKPRYNAHKCAKWGTLGWLIQLPFDTPIIDFFYQASVDMVDIQAAILFQALECQDSYLRIQETGLEGLEASTDVATPENLRKLAEIGKKLLEKPLTRVNLSNGTHEVVDGGKTYKQALTQFARQLHEERKRRIQNGEIANYYLL